MREEPNGPSSARSRSSASPPTASTCGTSRWSRRWSTMECPPASRHGSSAKQEPLPEASRMTAW